MLLTVKVISVKKWSVARSGLAGQWSVEETEEQRDVIGRNRGEISVDFVR
jgi:hypothetical protein